MPKVNHYAKEETEKESAVFRIEKYFRLTAWMYGYGLAATFHLSSSSPLGFLCLLLRYMYIINVPKWIMKVGIALTIYYQCLKV